MEFFNVELFVRVVAWTVAIGCTLMTCLMVFIAWGRNYTEVGQAMAALDALRGLRQVYPARYPLGALLAWIAIYCLN